MLEPIIIGREHKDIEKFGTDGTIFLGKAIVGTGFDTHMTNPIRMDVAKPHAILIAGKRGTGKSYTMAVMAEEMMKLPEAIKKQLSMVLIDTMGIFWSMKDSNDAAHTLLKEWGLEAKGFPSQNVVPIGLKDFYKKHGMAFDATFALKPSELTTGDWALTFGISLLEPTGILMERALNKLKGKDYGIKEIIDAIEDDKRADAKEKTALQNRFMSAEGWGIFSKEATPIDTFLKPGIATVLDVSNQDWPIRNLMVGILVRKLYEVRLAARRAEETSAVAGEKGIRKIPLTWVGIDEAHNFLPSEGETAATGPLLMLLRQGRQPGIGTIMITQRPLKLHEDAIAQSDLVIAHRLTAKPDLDSLGTITQTYALEDIRKMVSWLPKPPGSAVILDDISERLFNCQVRPRQSWHAGGTPSVNLK
ncbi:MAG: ATP-binding protein [Candidatus Aenigmatarchaeota archaeon]